MITTHHINECTTAEELHDLMHDAVVDFLQAPLLLRDDAAFSEQADKWREEAANASADDAAAMEELANLFVAAEEHLQEVLS